MLLSAAAEFPLALQLRQPGGAPLGEVFAFLSGLYFRGKLAYASAFAGDGAVQQDVRIITTNRGLLTPSDRVRRADLAGFATVDLASAGDSFKGPLLRDAERIDRENPRGLVVLLGSIATNKYVGPLLQVFGERLVFPREFVGRGDMSRGGLLLRHARDGRELQYITVWNAVRHGKRPPKLAPLK